ncbi:MAG TPA: RDD family protein, partial [Steroidobacteraceae bacterium]|nr:RDD family protein [Steroidobacteraceae bacterium]
MTEENNYRPPSARVADVQVQEEGELASRWARLGGSMLDGLIVGVIITPIMFATGYMQRAMNGVEPQFLVQLQYALLGLVLSAAINGYLLHKSGQSVGKRAAGTRIVSVDDNS